MFTTPKEGDTGQEIILIDENYQNTDEDEYEEDELAGIEEYAIIQEQNVDENSMLVEEYLTDDAQVENDIIEQLQYSEEEAISQDAFYNCNVCGLDFHSIDEHIADYHSGQDVILDIEPNENETPALQDIKMESVDLEEDMILNDGDEYAIDKEDPEEEYEEHMIEQREDGTGYVKSIVRRMPTNNSKQMELFYDIGSDKLCHKAISMPIKTEARNQTITVQQVIVFIFYSTATINSVKLTFYIILNRMIQQQNTVVSNVIRNSKHYAHFQRMY